MTVHESGQEHVTMQFLGSTAVAMVKAFVGQVAHRSRKARTAWPLLFGAITQ